jgi:UDP-N-acetylmuramoyl-L-alanyl-D-glutamate--2,6-diaminopimelate ligase
MLLRDLLPAGAEYESRFAGLSIGGIAVDSRRLRKSDLFVAVPGTKVDGLQFANAAIAAGAAAILAEHRPPGLSAETAFVKVPNARRALALIAARFFPRQPPLCVAVTGTSGKTSVAAFARQIWQSLGHEAASIGTVGLVTTKSETYGALTTPDPIELHRLLDGLAAEGVTHLIMEASSHGLDQHRLDGLRIAAGGFTNLTRDHLDYHESFEAYRQAKLRLFESLVPREGSAVINADGDQADIFAAAAKARGLNLMTVGRQGEAIRLVDATPDGFGQKLSAVHEGHTYRLRLPLVGAFQVENALVAAGLAIAVGSDAPGVFAALERLKGAKGRLELVAERKGAPIFVDYAHKPDALAKALEALRPYAKGRLVVVFGAGGDRDQGKRPLMGRIAAERADGVFVTDDNPRSEDPAAIRQAILSAAPNAIEVADRATAIRSAIAELQEGDILLIAGKGHETGQIVGDRVLPFTDHEAVRAALGETIA